MYQDVVGHGAAAAASDARSAAAHLIRHDAVVTNKKLDQLPWRTVTPDL